VIQSIAFAIPIALSVLSLAAFAQGPLAVDSVVDVIRPTQASSARTLYRALTMPGRGEFETTVEYQARINNRVKGNFYLVLVPPSLTELSYDADNSVMTARLGLWYDQGIRFALQRRRLGTYVGTNAFGVKTTVSRILDTAYYVNVPDASFRVEPDRVHFPMYADSARALKPHLSIAFVFRPAIDTSTGTITQQSRERIEPTRDSPIDVTEVARKLHVNFLAVLIYDRRSGRVVHRYVHRES
jgi:hypothetical protein